MPKVIKTKLTAKFSDVDPECADLLPHEILLRAARGHKFKVKMLEITYYKTGARKGNERDRKWVPADYVPTFQERMEAAKAAAPYYAPKKTSLPEVPKGGEQVSGVMLIPVTAGDDWVKLAQQNQAKLKNKA